MCYLIDKLRKVCFQIEIKNINTHVSLKFLYKLVSNSRKYYNLLNKNK